MKSILTFSVLLVFISGCGSDKRTNYTTEDTDGNPIMTEASMKILEELVSECETCKDTKNMKDCKYITPKAICEFYEIEEFKDDKTYVPYTDMHDIILGKFGTWVEIGNANDQSVLKTAQEYANNGQATVAVSLNGSYGHVVIIVPGHLKTGKSWGLDVPNCASFFMVENLNSFASKPLNYAWRSSDNIKIYTRSLD